jgi:hypothetical protein
MKHTDTGCLGYLRKGEDTTTSEMRDKEDEKKRKKNHTAPHTQKTYTHTCMHSLLHAYTHVHLYTHTTHADETYCCDCIRIGRGQRGVHVWVGMKGERFMI